MTGRILSNRSRDRSGSSDGLEPVIVVLQDGSIRLFSHDDAPLSAQTVLSEFPGMSLASLDGPSVSPSAPLVPGETYFLTPRRAPAREEASSIRFATPPPAAWAGASAFRAPASLPLRSPRAVSDGNIPLMRGGAAGGWALRRDLEASVANVSLNHVATFPTTATTTAAAAATIESIQTVGVWSRASSPSAIESPSCASGSIQSREETLETCFAAQESFGSGRGSSFGSGRAGDDDGESDWSRCDHYGPSISFNGRHGSYYTDNLNALVLQKSRTYSGAAAQRGSENGSSRLHANEVPSRCHEAPSPQATPNPILAELAVLEEELPLELPLEELAAADFAAWGSSPATTAATSGTSGASGAPRAAPPAIAEAASLKGKVLAALSRFTPRQLRRAASASSSSKEAMATTVAPLPGSAGFSRRNADLPPVAMAAAASHRGFGHSVMMCGDDAESAQGWVDVEGPVLMMTDTRIRHRAPSGSRSSAVMTGRQGRFSQQEWHPEITEMNGTQFSTGPAGGINPSAPRELHRAPSLEAAQQGEHSSEHCDNEWHRCAYGLTARQRAHVRLSEDLVNRQSGNAAARNEYFMPPASERYLSGPPLLQATY